MQVQVQMQGKTSLFLVPEYLSSTVSTSSPVSRIRASSPHDQTHDPVTSPPFASSSSSSFPLLPLHPLLPSIPVPVPSLSIV